MKALKVWELDLTVGKKYVDVFGEVWEVVGNPAISPKFGYLPPDIDTDLRREKDGALFTDNLQGVQHLRLWTFKEAIDWSTVPVDTKILVWDQDAELKRKRHFAGVAEERGKIRAWDNGRTSFTETGASEWMYAELYYEEEE